MYARYIETDDFLPLPCSKNRYSVNNKGEVLDTSVGLINPTVSENGEKFVRIDWIDGLQDRPVALLVACAFKNIHIPVTRWREISVSCIDGNVCNIRPSNLTWKFKNPIKSSFHHGYVFVPGFTRYVINRTGDVICHLTGKILSKQWEKWGYCKYTIKTDLGQWTKIGRHRLLLLAYSDYPLNWDELDINHIDGVPGNDTLSNLEWCTRKENCDHALKFGLWRFRPILIRNVKTGEVSKYRSIVDAAAALGISKDAVAWRANRVGQPVFQDFNQYKFEDDPNPWVIPENFKNNTFKIGKHNPILVRNVLTGKVMEFKKQRECSVEMGINESKLSIWLNLEGQPVLPGYLQVKYADDETPWRIPENPEEELSRFSGVKAVLVRSIIENSVTEYPSARQCGRDLGISPTTLDWRLKTKGQKVYPGLLQFKYKSDLTPWKNPSEEELKNLKFRSTSL